MKNIILVPLLILCVYTLGRCQLRSQIPKEASTYIAITNPRMSLIEKDHWPEKWVLLRHQLPDQIGRTDFPIVREHVCLSQD